MSQDSKTIAQLKRQVARLQAQLKAAEAFMDRDRSAEFRNVMELADFRERSRQAVELLTGRFDE